MFNNTIVNWSITGARAIMLWPKAVGCITRSYDFRDPNTHLVVVNNVLVQPASSTSPYFAAYQASSANTIAAGNLCFGIGACSGPLSDSVYGDPQFVNAARNDFHVAETSPAVDASTAGPVSAADLDGKPRSGTRTQLAPTNRSTTW
jgi:hypothetical protein